MALVLDWNGALLNFVVYREKTRRKRRYDGRASDLMNSQKVHGFVDDGVDKLRDDDDGFESVLDLGRNDAAGIIKAAEKSNCDGLSD